MMQENPFFSKPIIFYGLPDHDEEEEEDSENWQLQLNLEFQQSLEPKIGLFFHWFPNIE